MASPGHVPNLPLGKGGTGWLSRIPMAWEKVVSPMKGWWANKCPPNVSSKCERGDVYSQSSKRRKK